MIPYFLKFIESFQTSGRSPCGLSLLPPNVTNVRAFALLFDIFFVLLFERFRTSGRSSCGWSPFPPTVSNVRAFALGSGGREPPRKANFPKFCNQPPLVAQFQRDPISELCAAPQVVGLTGRTMVKRRPDHDHSLANKARCRSLRREKKDGPRSARPQIRG